MKSKKRRGLIIILVLMTGVLLYTSCNRETCPAYAQKELNKVIAENA